MVQPMDRQKRKPTKAEQQEIFKNAIVNEMQAWYTKGIVYGSHMQCSTILEVFKKKIEETPKSKQTKAFYEELVNRIFSFCELGLASDLEAILNPEKNLNKNNTEVSTNGETEEV